MNLEKIIKMSKSMSDNYKEVALASIYLEIEDRARELKLTNEEIEGFLRVAVDVQYEVDYATPTGVGMAMCDYMTKETADYCKDYGNAMHDGDFYNDFLYNYYLSSDWQ